MLYAKKAISCEEVRELLFEYAEGTLDKALCDSVKRHLEDCASCREELNEAQSILDAVAASTTEPPSRLYSNVMQKVASTEQEPLIIKSKRKYGWLGTVAAACAVFAIVIAGRHVIFSGGGVAVNDASEQAIGVVTTARDANGIERFSETKGESLPVNAPTHGQPAADDTIKFTTAAVTASSPAVEAASDAPEYADAHLYTSDTSVISEASVKSVIDGVYSMLSASDSAVLVCLESEFSEMLPDYVGSITVNGTAVELYREANEAKSRYVHCLECLHGEGIYHRAALPLSRDFSVFDLYLIDDVEN